MPIIKKPTLGLALSGSGNRTTFYIGFLDVLRQAGVQIDYISACSGGSVVAAAFACGHWAEFKNMALTLDKDDMNNFFIRGKERGGLYSLDRFEEEMLKFTGGMTFEEVRPLMAFVAVDIETGELVNLLMGDIAKAARISCTLPFVFEPVKWGGKTLVDGGLLSYIPLEPLRLAGIDITIGINMRGTKHIFNDRILTAKKILNAVKKYLLIDNLENLINDLLSN